MSQDSALLQQAKQTEVETDHSKVSQGGPRLPAEGKSPARLVGYVELGKHPQPDYAGKAKNPEVEVQLTFECFGPKNVDEIEVDGKKKTVGRIIRPLPMTLKLNERAKFYQQFKNMDYGRGLDHMSKMLNDVFMVTIEHAKSNKGTEYAKLTKIESPLLEKLDNGVPTGDLVDVSPKIPPASYGLQLFVLEKPTFEQWASIEIEGTYTRKTKNEETGEEVEEEVSKNFLQEKIKAALDWEGSPMQTLLLNLDDDTTEEVVEEKEEKPAKKKATKTTKKEAPKEEEAETPSDDADDMLAELGLDG